jgi:hypothetical protein
MTSRLNEYAPKTSNTTINATDASSSACTLRLRETPSKNSVTTPPRSHANSFTDVHQIRKNDNQVLLSFSVGGSVSSQVGRSGGGRPSIAELFDIGKHKTYYCSE